MKDPFLTQLVLPRMKEATKENQDLIFKTYLTAN